MNIRMLLALVFLNLNILQAEQDGVLDTLFATNGQLITTFEPAFAVVPNAIQIQNDSKIVVAGRQNSTGFFVARYYHDGTQDTSFGTNGFTFTPISGISSIAGSDMVIQPNGAILVAGGGIATATNHNVIAVVRYTSSGALDTTFANNGVAFIDTGIVGDVRQRAMIALKKNGSIVIATSVGPYGATSQGVLAQLLPNGALDQNFATGGLTPANFFGGVSVSFYQALIQDDQKIVVIGDFSPDGTAQEFFVARYLATGILDTTFAGKGYVITQVNAGNTAGAAGGGIQADGKIVAYGSNNANPPLYLARYNTDGTLDASFANPGIAVAAAGVAAYPNIGNIVAPSCLGFQTDGKILVEAGAVANAQNVLGVMRADTNGLMDTSFGENGMAIATDILGIPADNSQPRALAFDKHGEINALGVVLNNSIGIVRYKIYSLQNSALSNALWQVYYNQDI